MLSWLINQVLVMVAKSVRQVMIVLVAGNVKQFQWKQSDHHKEWDNGEEMANVACAIYHILFIIIIIFLFVLVFFFINYPHLTLYLLHLIFLSFFTIYVYTRGNNYT